MSSLVLGTRSFSLGKRQAIVFRQRLLRSFTRSHDEMECGVSNTKVAIIGSGPAGYTAALYLSRAGLNPLVFAGFANGGQLMLTHTVENYPGYPNGISGPQLMANMRAQAEHFGATILDVDIDAVESMEGKFALTSAFGDNLSAEAVIIATGAEAIWLDAENEDTFKGRGISTCATCDGTFFKEKDVVVVGGGDTACEEALYLANLCSKVKERRKRN